MFWEHFLRTLGHGYVVVPFPNPPSEFVYIHVLWVIAVILLATLGVWFCLWQVARMGKPRSRREKISV